MRKNIELSPISGLEPASREKGQMPISNQLRPKEFFECDRCVSGWSDIYDHSTNPVKLRTSPSKAPFMPQTAFVQLDMNPATSTRQICIS